MTTPELPDPSAPSASGLEDDLLYLSDESLAEVALIQERLGLKSLSEVFTHSLCLMAIASKALTETGAQLCLVHKNGSMVELKLRKQTFSPVVLENSKPKS